MEHQQSHEEPYLTYEEIEAVLLQRYLTAPALTAGEVEAKSGCSANDPRLIRLDSQDAGVVLPAFQFDELGKPYQVVLDINLILDADYDNLAACGWWLDRNGYIDDVPARLLGRGPGFEDTLRALADLIGNQPS